MWPIFISSSGVVPGLTCVTFFLPLTITAMANRSLSERSAEKEKLFRAMLQPGWCQCMAIENGHSAKQSALTAKRRGQDPLELAAVRVVDEAALSGAGVADHNWKDPRSPMSHHESERTGKHTARLV